MLKRFTEHPASVNETYLQHMRVALFFCGRFCYGAIAALVHAFFPFLFEKTGSELIDDLHKQMVVNRTRKTADRFKSYAQAGLADER